MQQNAGGRADPHTPIAANTTSLSSCPVSAPKLLKSIGAACTGHNNAAEETEDQKQGKQDDMFQPLLIKERTRVRGRMSRMTGEDEDEHQHEH